jgi:hypothetical protein
MLSIASSTPSNGDQASAAEEMIIWQVTKNTRIRRFIAVSLQSIIIVSIGNQKIPYRPIPNIRYDWQNPIPIVAKGFDLDQIIAINHPGSSFHD